MQLNESIPLRVVSSATLANRYDLIVVGAGIAGLVLSASVASLGTNAKVLIVDAGELGPRLHLDSSDRVGPSAFERWCGVATDPWAQVRQSADGSWETVGRRIVGGRGLYWGGTLMPISPRDFRSDPQALTWLEESCLFATGGGYDSVRSMLKAVGYLESGDELFPQALSNGRLSLRSCTRARRTEGGASRIFSPLSLFSINGNQGRTELLPGWEVVCAEAHADGHRIHFHRNGERQHTCARKIVLAAGTIENAIILFNSLRRDHLTLTMEDHLVAGAAAWINRNAAPSNLYELFSDKLYVTREERFNLFIALNRNSHGLSVDAWGMAEKDRESPAKLHFGRVASDMPVSIEGHKTEADLNTESEMLSAATAAVAHVCYALGLSADCGEEISETRQVMRGIYEGTAPSHVVNRYVSTLGTVDHEGCLSGLEGRARGWDSGLPGMYLAGPCSFLRMGAANPSFTSMALATQLSAEVVS